MGLTRDDKDEIVELCNRYALAIDDDDIEAWMATWSDDGVMEASFGTARGKDKLRALQVTLEQGLSKGKRHVSANHVVAGDGDAATARSYFIILDRDTNAVVATGVFADDLQRVDGAWTFAHRTLTTDPNWGHGQGAR